MGLIIYMKRLLDFTRTDGLDTVPGESKFFLIGELGDFLGLDPKTIRYYEKEGLLAPVRQGKFRVFKIAEVNRLRAIKKFRDFGLSISSIREIFRYQQENLNSGNENEFAINILRKQLDVMAKEKETLARNIEDLAQLMCE